jgi:hypothetical protein
MTNQHKKVIPDWRGRLALWVMRRGIVGSNEDYAICRYNKILAKIASKLVKQNYFEWLEHQLKVTGLWFTLDEEDKLLMAETAKQLS